MESDDNSAEKNNSSYVVYRPAMIDRRNNLHTVGRTTEGRGKPTMVKKKNQASSTNGGEEDTLQRLFHTVPSLYARSDEQSRLSEEAERRYREAEERHMEALRMAQEKEEELQQQLDAVKTTRGGETSTQMETSPQIFWG
ncbi:hypothetical protein CR513_48331, partial [Mucuna pruriens]